MLSYQIAATRAYLGQAVATTQVKPTKITSNKNKTYTKAKKAVLGLKSNTAKASILTIGLIGGKTTGSALPCQHF